IGFDRWSENVIAADAEPGFYKVSNQFLVQVKNAEVHTPYLILPSDKRTIPGWNDEEYQGFRQGPIKVPDAMFAEETVDDEPGLVIAENHRPLVAVAKATLPDFTRYYDASLMNPKVLVGAFLGAMSTFLFCAMTMKAVGRAAKGMVEEVRRQFREKPGIMNYTEKPDYAAPVAISTRAAQREMILPSLLALATPVVTGLILGVAGVMGLLVGALTTGFCLAVFMANAGGAWDNAKKYIEAGAHGGKGTDAHKAAVVGDTVGDPFKDTSGPSLNILIKLMSMVAVVVAGLTVRYSLMALGIF
ncbi:MAG: sodium/proton-translocating pyrophosphatase, partial [Pirellulales bacterium]